MSYQAEISTISNLKIGPRHQITIPNDVFKKLKLKAGDFLGLDFKDDKLVLFPTAIIPRDQAWFWSKEWQKKIKEAEEDVAQGRLSGPFANAKNLISHLKNQDENRND